MPDGQVVVAYTSCLLKSFELKYAVLQKEALGIIWSLKHFCPYLFGIHFTIITEHRPLRWLRNMNAPNNLLTHWIRYRHMILKSYTVLGDYTQMQIPS